MVNKTMRGVLTEEQLSRCGAVRDERNRSYYQSTIETCLVAMEDLVPMTAAQHDGMVKLLVEETPAPPKYGALGYIYVCFRLATFSDQRLAQILDDRQRLLLERHLADAEGLKPFLIQQGLLPPEDPASDVDSEALLRDAQK